MCTSSDHNVNSYSHYACFAIPNFASPNDNTHVVLTLSDSSFPLTQCIGIEVAQPFGFVARFDVVDACFKSKDILDELHDLDKTPLEGSLMCLCMKSLVTPPKC